MKKKLLLSLGCILMLSGCNKVTLSNGEEAVTTFDEGGISAETLYETLKDKYGIETLIDLIDTDLLERLYDKSSSETSYINDNVKSVKSTVKENSYDLDSYIEYYYKVNSVTELKEYFRLNYRRQLWLQDYAKTIVTDKEIESYYKKYTIGDIDLSWILITVDSTDSDTSDVKNQAEAEALATAKEVIKKLDAGENFADLAKKYSKDTTTASNGGSLGTVNRGSVSDTVIEAAIALNEGKYSTEPLKTSEGYAILWVNSKEDKPEFNDDTKDDITDTIVDEKVSNDDGTLYLESLEALRSRYSMTFKDSSLSTEYTEYMNKLKNSITSSSNS